MSEFVKLYRKLKQAKNSKREEDSTESFSLSLQSFKRCDFEAEAFLKALFENSFDKSLVYVDNLCTPVYKQFISYTFTANGNNINAIGKIDNYILCRARLYYKGKNSGTVLLDSKMGIHISVKSSHLVRVPLDNGFEKDILNVIKSLLSYKGVFNDDTA